MKTLRTIWTLNPGVCSSTSSKTAAGGKHTQLKRIIQITCEVKIFARDLFNKLVQWVGNNHLIRSFCVNAVALYIAEEAHRPNDSFTPKTAMALTSEYPYFNEMQYPNSHIHFSSCTILYFFADHTKDIITEQITR